MQILTAGQSLIPPRKKPSEVINASAPTKPQRIKLNRDAVLWAGGGERLLGRAGDVLQVDRATAEGWEILCGLCGNSDAGVKVSIDTPLFSAPAAPPPPPASAPEKTTGSIMELARALVTALREAGTAPKPSKA